MNWPPRTWADLRASSRSDVDVGRAIHGLSTAAGIVWKLVEQMWSGVLTSQLHYPQLRSAHACPS
jgi:hypothetical protein